MQDTFFVPTTRHVPSTPDTAAADGPRPEPADETLLIGLRQRRMRQILWVFMAGFALLALVNLAQARWPSAIIELVAVALFALALRRNARGNEDAAARLTLVTMFAALIGLMAAGQGLYDEAPIAFPGLLVFASMFGSRRLLNALAALMLAALLAMYALHQSGLLPSQAMPLGLPRLMVLAIVVVVTGLLVAMTSSDMRQLMQRLQREKQALLLSHERITELAYHDSLTGLANRTLAKERLGQMLAQAQQDGQMVMLLFLDLDNFKTINDSLGHAAGDTLLRQVAQRLLRCVGAEDTVARVSGDEFLLLRGKIASEESILATAGRVMEQLAAPFELLGLKVYASGSLGISVYPRDGSDLDALLKNADLAMYRAKDAGRNTFRFFDAQMNASVVEQLHIASHLREALAHDELQLHYQPQRELASGRIVGAEALARWQHPTLGWVAPTKFIAVAERSGLIHELGTWVLARACRDAREWRMQGLGELRVAVNVSPLQFKRADIAGDLAQALTQHGLPASAIELEITESMLVSDTDQLEDMLESLHQLGVQIAIDDFGTGYSNLGYLQRYAVHRLKIDQGFIRRLTSGAQAEGIVRAIIEMAHCLDLQVVAEGVEDAATLARLSDFGCELGQGYHWSPALPQTEFISYVRRHQRAHQTGL